MAPAEIRLHIRRVALDPALDGSFPRDAAWLQQALQLALARDMAATGRAGGSDMASQIAAAVAPRIAATGAAAGSAGAPVTPGAYPEVDHGRG